MTLVGLYTFAFAFNVVPETDATVESPGEDKFAIRAENNAGDGGVILMNESAQALACCGIPDANQPVVAARHNERAVADKVNATDRIAVRRERAHDACGSYVPKVDGFIIGAADKHVTFGAKGDAVYIVVMPDKGRRMCQPRTCIPEADRFIVRPAGENLTVR